MVCDFIERNNKLTYIRSKIFEIIQPAKDGNFASKIFDVVISTLVLLSVAAVFAGTFELSQGWTRVLRQFEIFVSIVFTVEYLARLFTADLLFPNVSRGKATMRYIFSGMAIVDLLAILPFYLPMIFPCNMMMLRMFRLLRLLRIFKLNRYFESLSALGYVLKSKSRDLIGSMFVVGILLVMASLAIYAAEHDAQPQVFKNAFSGLWWAVATLTTVGYGDIYPVTVLGRVLGALIALLGIGMVAIPTGIISSGLVDYLNSQKKDEASVVSKEVSECSFCPHCGKRLK